MISKEQFLELKHLKSLGVPTTTIAKKLGISVPSANKWLRLDEETFNTHLINNTPYLEQYRAFILSILKICPQTPATNIMYRIKNQFPDFVGLRASFREIKSFVTFVRSFTRKKDVKKASFFRGYT